MERLSERIAVIQSLLHGIYLDNTIVDDFEFRKCIDSLSNLHNKLEEAEQGQAKQFHFWK